MSRVLRRFRLTPRSTRPYTSLTLSPSLFASPSRSSVGSQHRRYRAFKPLPEIDGGMPGILEYDDGPLVWVDCEMTGLDVPNDRIIEIAVIITNGRLEPVDEGINYIIQTDKSVLDAMGPWCVDQHGKSGLTQACIDSPYTHKEVTQKVREYVEKWIPERGAGLLAGSTVHADMRFLLKEMPEVMKHLSYRILDVSSVKEICRRWYPSVRQREQESRTGESSHRALDDIKASIRELAFYRDNIFLPVETPRPAPSDPTTERKTAL